MRIRMRLLGFTAALAASSLAWAQQSWFSESLARSRESQEAFRYIDQNQENPAGGTESQLAGRRRHPIVQTGIDVVSYLLKDSYPDVKASAVASGSTDGNAGVELGIPTIAVGRTFGKDQHTLQESAEIKPLFLATKQIVLLAYALGKLEM